jgi:hypothetical protein
MSITLKWGLITGMVYVIFALITNMLGLQQSGGGSVAIGMLMNALLLGITFFTIYSGVKETRDNEMDGAISLGQAFKIGMTITVIAGALAGLFTLLNMTLIDPEMGSRMLEAAEDQWDKANMPEEQREMSKKFMAPFLNPFIAAPFTLVWVAFWGAIKSLIAGAILKKEAPPTLPTE